MDILVYRNIIVQAAVDMVGHPGKKSAHGVLWGTHV